MVPIEVNRLPLLFEQIRIGQRELLGCEPHLASVLIKFAKTVGFDVELDEWEDASALLLRKPYPYWHFAFSGEKKDVLPGRFFP